MGDAGQWGPNAAAMGFPEGKTPRPGAVMVTWEGPIGHVAYVESVNSDGSWNVSEMNYKGWNVVSQRTISPGSVPLETFIY
jgi:surface antigen